jgi:hypothetical protein
MENLLASGHAAIFLALDGQKGFAALWLGNSSFFCESSFRGSVFQRGRPHNLHEFCLRAVG